MTELVLAPSAALRTSLDAARLAGELPDRALLESVRDLGARFPDARLREVAVVRARELDVRADPSGATRVWLALESLQVTGSFKVRGALVAVDAVKKRAVASGATPYVVAASAGNHGAGVAYAARALGVRATVVVPTTAPRAKRDRIAAYGAEVRLGPTAHYDDAEGVAIELAAREGASFVSPYDDLDVLSGNGASLAFEIARAVGRVPEGVIAPSGGGGLNSGLACGFAHVAGESLLSLDGARRRVWGAQSEASPAMARSLQSGVAVERLLANDTLADGLEGGIARRAFERVSACIRGVAVVSEASIASAIAYGVRELGLVIEGSAACALVPVLDGLPTAMCGGDLVAVLTGRNIDSDTIERILR